MTGPAIVGQMSDVDTLRTAIMLTMERLCFTSAESFADDLPAGATLDASVAFRGPVSGAVGVAVPPRAVPGFLDALLLPDARADRLAHRDFVCELASIVCGNVVPRIFGRNAVYILSPPELARPSAPVVATAVVHVTGGWVAATLHRDA